jgi:hypothetical protein
MDGTHGSTQYERGGARVYNQRMARGWESKSVEAQQDEAAARTAPGKPRLTREEAARRREREKLQLALRSVLEQMERSRDSRHRAMLEQAAAALKRQLGEGNG